jgi:Domain of unknown function (DUF6398)
MRNGSCPRSAASRHISVRGGICCRPPDGATRWPTASPSGTRSPRLPGPFRWEGIPDDATACVREVLALTDRCCDEMLDIEYRTACRRVLARVASMEPEAFRRKGRAETAAAALVWIVGKANDLFERRPGGIRVRDLMNHFGLQQSSIAQRGATILRAGGFRDDTYIVRLGSPDYLVAARRRRIINARESYRQLAEEMS